MGSASPAPRPGVCPSGGEGGGVVVRHKLANLPDTPGMGNPVPGLCFGLQSKAGGAILIHDSTAFGENHGGEGTGNVP